MGKACSSRKQKNNDPYGVDLASKKDKGFVSQRKIQNRFKLIKKQNLENRAIEKGTLEGEQPQVASTLQTLINSSRSSNSDYAYNTDTFSSADSMRHSNTFDKDKLYVGSFRSNSSEESKSFNRFATKDLEIIYKIGNFSKRQKNEMTTKIFEEVLKFNRLNSTNPNSLE